MTIQWKQYNKHVTASRTTPNSLFCLCLKVSSCASHRWCTLSSSSKPMTLMANKRLGAVVLMIVATSAAFGLWLRQPSRADAFHPNPGSRKTLDSLPATILWAWERPEQLDFIDTHRIGVAYLAKTIQFRDGDLAVRPRLQRLSLQPGTRVVAVVRIETDRQQSRTFEE